MSKKSTGVNSQVLKVIMLFSFPDQRTANQAVTAEDQHFLLAGGSLVSC